MMIAKRIIVPLLFSLLVITLVWAQYTPPYGTGGTCGALGGDLSGTCGAATVASVPAAALPAPSSSTLGGVKSLAAVSGKWINTISTSGAPAATQPSTSDVTEGSNLYYTDARVLTEVGNIAANNVQGTSAGTAYTLTTTYGAVTFGTTNPNITIGAAGTYALYCQARIDNISATYAADRLIVLGLERTNNTPATIKQIASHTGVVGVGGDPGDTHTVDNFFFVALYTTSNSNDAIGVSANVSVGPTAGSTTVASVDITAIRIK